MGGAVCRQCGPPHRCVDWRDATLRHALGTVALPHKRSTRRRTRSVACPLQKVDGLPPKELRKLVDKGKKELGDGIIIVFASKDDKVGIAVGVTDSLTEKFNAVKFVKVGSEIIGGQGGGGRKDFAQAGGQDQSKIDQAFEKLKTLI